MALVEGRRLSWTRLGVVLVVAAAVVFASQQGWRWFQDSRVEVTGSQWYAGYVDVTATPTYAFEDPAPGTGASAVLSFVVADPDQACRPSWGGAYTLAEADDQLDLARRIARLDQLGGEPVVSFGGQANTDLAVACADLDKLTEAYESVVKRYDVRVIDLDVEGEALSDTASHERRAQAVARLQARQGTKVWITLPVDPRGLTEDGLASVRSLVSAGVDLSGINVMTMNFAQSKDPEDSMAQASIKALEATHDQISTLQRASDDRLTDAQVWRLLGATAMIGQNDVVGEVFDLDDAARLKKFADSKELGRLSMWSLNRDLTCSNNWPDVTQVSTSCSGLNQQKGAFSQIFGAKRQSGPSSPSPSAVAPTASATSEPTDDPSTSPYQVWNAEQAYQSGERVVWRRNVYAAKWWTSGDVPDNPTVAEADAPWRLIGPVLPGDTPEPLPTVAPGTYPAWRPAEAYTAGDRVQVGDTAYVALWWTQGASPDAPATQDSPSPWRRLTAKEVANVNAPAAQGRPGATATPNN